MALAIVRKRERVVKVLPNRLGIHKTKESCAFGFVFVCVRLSELSMAKGVVRRRPKPKEKGSDSEVPQFKYLYSYAQAAPPA